MTKSIFARRLIALRHSRLLSQPQLAEATQLGKTTIGKWEADETEPALTNLVRLAAFFGCSADYLCGLSDTPERLPPGHWVIDLDRYDAAIAGDTVDLWAAPIPSRSRVCDSQTYHRLMLDVMAKRRSLS